MSTELLDAIRAAVEPLTMNGAIHDSPTISLHPDDWEYLTDTEPRERSLFEDGNQRAIFGCKVLLDDGVEPGTAVAA